MSWAACSTLKNLLPLLYSLPYLSLYFFFFTQPLNSVTPTSFSPLRWLMLAAPDSFKWYTNTGGGTHVVRALSLKKSIGHEFLQFKLQDFNIYLIS